MTMYDPQDTTGLGYGAPPAFNPNAPVIDATGMQLDQFLNCLQQTQWTAWGNTTTPTWLLSAWRGVAAQLTPGPPLAQLSSAINQMQFGSTNNAALSGTTITNLANAHSQLTLGPTTTNPPDVAAIGQLQQAIINQEPSWAPLLWINWTSATTTLTVQVRGFYTLNQVISTVPWWTNWPSFYDGASQIIATIYLLEMATATGRFDPTLASTDMTVSADGLTATRTQVTTAGPPTGAPRTALSTPAKIAPVYAEVQMHKLAPLDNLVGISNSAQELTNINRSWLGAPGNNSIGWYDNGQIYFNGALIATIGGYFDGDIVAVALDNSAATVQFRNVSGNGVWSTAYSISLLGAAPYRLGITVYELGESATANFTGPFLGTVIPGFGSWN